MFLEIGGILNISYICGNTLQHCITLKISFMKPENNPPIPDSEKTDKIDHRSPADILPDDVELEYWEGCSIFWLIPSTPNVVDLEQTVETFRHIDFISDFDLIEQEDDDNEQVCCSFVYQNNTYMVTLHTAPISGEDFVQDHSVLNRHTIFSTDELDSFSNATSSLVLSMMLDGSPLRAYHLQIKLSVALMPHLLAVYDESAEQIKSGRWIKQTAASSALPLPLSMVNFHTVGDSEEDVWLHTHGLCRCGLSELEMLHLNSDTYHTAMSIMETLIMNRLYLLDTESEIDDDILGRNFSAIQIGFFSDELPAVVTDVPWNEALTYYPKNICGGWHDRKEGHNNYTSVLMLYPGEAEEMLNEPVVIGDMIDKIGDNPLLWVSKDHTRNMEIMAQNQWKYVVQALQLNGFDHHQYDIVAKVGLPIVNEKDNSSEIDKEHIWFEVIEADGDGFTGRLTQAPFYIPDIKEGDVKKLSLDMISDWAIYTPKARFDPDNAYLLDILYFDTAN